jgi:hypothetical protein
MGSQVNIDPTKQLILALGQQAFEAAVMKAQIETLERALADAAHSGGATRDGDKAAEAKS